MADVNDSSGFLDESHSEVTFADRPEASFLRQRPRTRLNESADDYTDLFRALQIRPELHERFLDGVLKVIRNKHIKELQKGSEAGIRLLTKLVMRGYRNIVWKESSEWLLGEDDLDDGEEKLVRGGDNERFYPLLEPVWWKMRELVFEPKPPPKSHTSRKRGVKRNGNAEDAYEADADTELEVRTPHDRARDQTLRKFNKLIASAPEPSPRYMSADETDKAIFDLVVQVADIRARSDPATFEQAWDQHIGRLQEIEDVHHSNGQADEAASIVVADVDQGKQIEAVRDTPSSTTPPFRNLSNEPRATEGLPLPQSWPPSPPPRLPEAMAVYITTAPAQSPYTHQAYEWPGAPVRMVDQRAFYNGVMSRVEMRDEHVQGLVMSYGWCDVCRWVVKCPAGEREGWDVLQNDLKWAAGRGVRMWRMKILVVSK